MALPFVWIHERQRAEAARDTDFLQALRSIRSSWKAAHKDAGAEEWRAVHREAQCMQLVLTLYGRWPVGSGSGEGGAADDIQHEYQQLDKLVRRTMPGDITPLSSSSPAWSEADFQCTWDAVERFRVDLGAARSTVHLGVRARGGQPYVVPDQEPQEEDAVEVQVVTELYHTLRRHVELIRQQSTLEATAQQQRRRLARSARAEVDREASLNPMLRGGETTTEELCDPLVAFPHCAVQQLEESLASLRSDLVTLQYLPAADETESDTNKIAFDAFLDTADLSDMDERLWVSAAAIRWQGRSAAASPQSSRASSRAQRRLGDSVSSPTRPGTSGGGPPVEWSETPIDRQLRQVDAEFGRLATELRIPESDVVYFRTHFMSTHTEDGVKQWTRLVETLQDSRAITVSVLRGVSDRESIVDALQAVGTTIAEGGFHKLNTQSRVLQLLYCLQRVTLCVVELVGQWRGALTRPYPFSWNGENYLLRIMTQCERLDAGPIREVLPLRLSQCPLCSNLQSLPLFAPDPDLQRPLDVLSNPPPEVVVDEAPPVDPDMLRRLLAAEQVLLEESDAQRLLTKELATLQKAERFLPVVMCADVPNCHSGLKVPVGC